MMTSSMEKTTTTTMVVMKMMRMTMRSCLRDLVIVSEEGSCDVDKNDDGDADDGGDDN